MNAEHQLRSLNPDIFYEISRSEMSHFFSNSGSLHKKIKRTHRFPEQTRPYQPGDPIKFIDWRQYARTDLLSVNQIAENSPAVVQIVVYLSDTMAWPPTSLALFKFDIQKCELAQRLALCLAYLHSKNLDDVTLTFCVDNKSQSTKFKTPNQVLQQFQISELDKFELNTANWQPRTATHQSGDFLYLLSDFLPQSVEINNLEFCKNFSRALFLQTLHSKEYDISWLKDDVCAVDDEPPTKSPLGKELHAQNYYNLELEKWVLSLKRQFDSEHVEFASLHDAMAVEDWLHILHEFTG